MAGDEVTRNGRSPVKSFRDLIVWQRANELAISIYKSTQPFPREELFGLTSQLRRSLVSIPSNIAEGQGRLTTGEFRQFLGMARGSNCELQAQLEIARALEFGDGARIKRAESLSVEAGKMINAILLSLNE
jgi:four helix bundle protein